MAFENDGGQLLTLDEKDVLYRAKIGRDLAPLLTRVLALDEDKGLPWVQPISIRNMDFVELGKRQQYLELGVLVPAMVNTGVGERWAAQTSMVMLRVDHHNRWELDEKLQHPRLGGMAELRDVGRVVPYLHALVMPDIETVVELVQEPLLRVA